MDSFKVRLAHAKHSKISEYNITVLNLMLGSIGCYIHAIKLFNETAFSEEGTYNSQATGGIMRSFVNSTIMFLLVFSVIRWLLFMVKGSNP